MTSEALTICGHRLPDMLTFLVRNGLWSPPAPDIVTAVFGEEPSSPEFYGFAGMVDETTHLLEMDPDYQVWYRGTEVGQVFPGIVALDSCVLIGDLGPERPIALDYGMSSLAPQVVLLTNDGWRQIRSEFRTLARDLGLIP